VPHQSGPSARQGCRSVRRRRRSWSRGSQTTRSRPAGEGGVSGVRMCVNGVAVNTAAVHQHCSCPGPTRSVSNRSQ
jgi:hypothetical protein